ncbi:hypothetical protein DITRI_Ditri09bG0058200 [Diplodiscus trichospermus]
MGVIKGAGWYNSSSSNELSSSSSSFEAEGFLGEVRDKHSIEDLGHEYFRDLLSRSLLQRSNKDKSQFVIDDFIHYLAQLVAGEICSRLEGDQEISTNTRHLSYIPSKLENAAESQDSWRAKLDDKSRLDTRVVSEKKVLDLLGPSKTLKELALKYYCGLRFAAWMEDSSFIKLLYLCLEDCPNCTSLPSIGQLPSLKSVRIKGLCSVTSSGVEFFGKKTRNAFLSLKSLEFEDMPKWWNWNFIGVDEKAIFPGLVELFINNCPKLQGNVPNFLPSWKKLVIRGCQSLVISVPEFSNLSELEIEGCQKAARWLLTSIKVEYLEICNCNGLCSLQENNWDLLTQSMVIGTLNIQKVSQIVSIGARKEKRRIDAIQDAYPHSTTENRELGKARKAISNFAHLHNT